MAALPRFCLTSFVLFLTFLTGVTAQDNPRLAETLREKFEKEAQKRTLYAPEQIHLLTDRNVYAAGDTLWLSAWVLNDQTLEPTTRSRMLYVDLIDPEQKVVQDLVLEIINGTAVGSFVFSENQKEDAFFQLRAYTRWSLNFDSIYTFHRIIPVWQDPKVAAADSTNQVNYVRVTKGASERQFWQRSRARERQTSAISDPTAIDSLLLDLSFLPEGGTWLTGFPCRMAWKALASDGYGVNVEGDILDQNDSVITTFRSDHLGMGSFLIVPEAGKKYSAKLITGQRIPLPDPANSGATLRTDLTGSNRVAVTIHTSPDQISAKDPYYLTVSAPGYNPYTYAVPRAKTRMSLDIPLEELPGGLVRFTLYTGKAEPLAERLLFLPSDSRQLHFNIESEITPTPVPGDGSGTMLKLKVQTSAGATKQPTSALLAVSVTDSLFAVPDSSVSTLRSQMLLEGFLKGKVENPEFYFSQPYPMIASQLDLLMMTQGWRGFAEPKPLVLVEKRGKTTTLTGEKALRYEPETRFDLSGRIENLFGGSVARQFLSLLAQGDYSFAQDRITDQMGRFSFLDMPLQGMTKLTLIVQKNNKERRTFNIGFEIDSTIMFKKPPVYTPVLPSESMGIQAVLADFRKKKAADRIFIDSLSTLPGMHYIEEVSITSKRIVKNSFNKNGPGNADIVFDEQRLGKYDRFNSLLEVLYNEIPGFGKGYVTPDLLFFSKVAREGYEPTAVIGKQRVYFRVDGSDATYFAFDSMVHQSDLDLGGGGTIEPTLFAKEQIYNQLMARLNLIPVSQIVGIEVMTSRNYVWTYMNEAFIGKSLDYIPPSVIEITTKSGKGLGMKEPGGQITLQMRGFSTPRIYYVPKYIPVDFVDRLEYHRKPTLFWTPSVATSDGGVAEISFPIGRNYPRTLRVSVSGYDLQGKVGNGETFILSGRERGTW